MKVPVCLCWQVGALRVVVLDPLGEVLMLERLSLSPKPA